MTTPIIEKNQSVANALTSAANAICRQYTAFLEEWQTLGLPGELPAVDRIRSLCSKPEHSVREWIYQNTPTLKSLPLEKEAVLKMIEVPDIRQLEQLAWDINHARPSADVPYIFFVTDGAKVSIASGFKEYVESKSKVIISGRKAEAQRRAEELMAQLNDFAKDFPELPLMMYQSGSTDYLFMQDGPRKPITFSKVLLSRVR